MKDTYSAIVLTSVSSNNHALNEYEFIYVNMAHMQYQAIW